MRRDMDLIRELLLKLETYDLHGGMAVINGYSEKVAIEGYEGDEISFHLRMIRDADLIESPSSQPADGGVTFRCLTWEGADFLDSVRDPETWAKTKKGAQAAGGFTVDLLKDLAKGFVRQQIKERTGVEL